MKKAFILVLIMIVLASLGFLGLRVITGYIYDQRDCDRFNIDHLEVRTGINIPHVIRDSSDCRFIGNTRYSTFLMDLERVNIDHYIEKNGLKPEHQLFIRRGENEDTKWTAAYDPSTQRLEIQVKYLD